MSYRLGSILLVAVAGVAWGAQAPSALPVVKVTPPPEVKFNSTIRPILQKHCFSCHSSEKAKGSLTLDVYADLHSIQKAKVTWRSVADMVEHKVMPPEDKRPLSDDERKALLAWVEEALAYCDCSGPRDPGFVAIHRLNRTEYNNTIRDLVGVDFRPADDFPADDTGYGFDNIADVLTMSPLLVEKYLAAAEAVMDKAMAPPAGARRNVTSWAGAEMKSAVGAKEGTAWKLSGNGELAQQLNVTTEGDHEVRITAWQEQAGPAAARMALRVDGRDVRVFEVKNLKDAPQVYKHVVPLRAGMRKVSVAFTNDYKDAANRDPKRRDRDLIVGAVEVEAQTAVELTETARKILFVQPNKTTPDEAAARQVIRRFATRAYRRPAHFEEIAGLMKLYAAARAEGDSHEMAVKHALTGVLVSPHFLFRIERDPAGVATPVHNLTEYELATRLSYFLWSSMPDDQLAAAAELSQLKVAGTMEKQVKRMLADAKAQQLVRNFAGQWLELRNLEEWTPDEKAYPGFDEKLKADMVRETELFFETIVREDRPVTDLLDADYTFVNGRLARHYGLADVEGEEFRKVSLKGSPRGGVLTHASVLAVTAMPSRTSPVKRGKFILENVLGAPPPPPPPDVPTLEKRNDAETASLRKRLELHRADPNCAVCHYRMDALGFSLENFDAIGAWRERDGGFAIDAVGQLPGGMTIDGPAGLKKLLAARRQEFVRCFVEKLMTYALGRGIEPYDQCTVKEIVAAAERDGYRFSSIVMGIVKSEAFQKRRGKKD